MYFLFNTTSVGVSRAEPQINIGDYLPADTLIRPGNLVFKRKFLPDGDRIVLDITYEQK